jgi:diguanylate cyclase (GGDEF)-like protein
MSTATLLLLASGLQYSLMLLFAVYLLALGLSLLRTRSARLSRVIETILGHNLRASFLVSLVMLAGVLPIMLGIGLAQRSAQQTLDHIEGHLHDTAAELTHSVDEMLSEHVRAVETAGRYFARSDYSPELVSTTLADIRSIYSGFLTMLVTDADGIIIGGVPRIDDLVLTGDLARLDVSDRNYFSVPRQSGNSFISSVFQGRGFGRDPIVAISAPIIGPDDRFRGIVEGSLDLAGFGVLQQESLYVGGAETLIVDSRNRVIHSSVSSAFPVLSDISGSVVIQSASGTPDGQLFRFSHQANNLDDEFIAAQGTTASGWKVFVMLDSDMPDAQLAMSFRVAAMWAVFTVFLGILLASALHRRIGHPVAHLYELVTRFDSEDVDRLLKSDMQRRGIPLEFKQIFLEFRNLRRRLMVAITRQREALRESERLRIELEDVVSEREQVIARRTAQLERANQLLDREAKVDSLTGLPNRRGLQEFLERSWRASQRHDEPLSVILIDVDHFKNYNDSFGHASGDICLQEIALVLQNFCRRPTDLSGRWGGEEFLVILGETDLDDARVIAEDIRRAVAAESARWAEATPSSEASGQVTISAGVAMTRPAEGADDYDVLINAADRALYRSKAEGRNRVTVSQPV